MDCTNLTILTRHIINVKLYKPITAHITTPPQTKANTLTVKVQSTNIRHKNTIHRPQRHQKTDPIILHHPCTTGHQYATIIWNLSGQYYDRCAVRHRIYTIKRYGKINGDNNTYPQLQSNPPQCEDTIPQERNVTPNPQLWLVSIFLQSTRPRWRILLYIRQNC